MHRHFLTFKRNILVAQNLQENYLDKKQEFLSYNIKLRNDNTFEFYAMTSIDESLIYKYAYIYYCANN